MEIRRKVYSLAVDENGEEKLFSTRDVELVDACLFSDKDKDEDEDESEKKEDKVLLEDVDSHRGLGRSLVFGGTPGAVGGYVGKKHADKLDREGKSDEEIKNETTKKAAKTGALTGGLGAGLGANKNTRVRLEKRAKIQRKK